MTWQIVLVAVVSALTGSGAAAVIRAVFSRGPTRADAVDSLSDTAIKQVEAAQTYAKEQIDLARADVRSARMEAVEARNEAGAARAEATAARREAMAAVAELRRLTLEILSPTASLERLRILVDPGSANGAATVRSY